jgi:glycosyltransferase involved in cell wall biosynthesis
LQVKSNPMHILLIHQAFTSLDEAGGTRHYEIATHLIAKGHQVTIITSPISYLTGQKGVLFLQKSQSPIPGLRIFRTYAYPALHKSFIHRVINFISFMVSAFIKSLQVRQVDLVWGTSPPIFQAVSAWLVARLKRVPFLLEVRDLWPAFAIEVGVLHNPLIIRLSLWLERFLYRHADLVVVNSPGYIEHVKNKGAKHVEMIPNGSDASMFKPQEKGKDFRKKNNLENKFLVIYAGAHGISNDLVVILQTAKLLTNNPNIHFLLVGDGKEKHALQQKAHEMQLSNLIFMDPVSKNQIAEVLAAADACIAILKPLELYKTTYPNKVFDYMAAGRPVLLVIDGVIRKVVEEAKCGLFVQPGNADDLAKKTVWLSQYLAKARGMGKAGQKYLMGHFNRIELANKFIKVMENLID